MSGVAAEGLLTEKRFLEFVELVRAQFVEVNKRLDRLDGHVKELREFQHAEAEAIEFEMEMILRRFLEHKFQLSTIKDFPVRFLNDPLTDRPITEFDAAFLIAPLKYTPNFQRAAAAGIYIQRESVSEKDSLQLVIAEAKHTMTANRIAHKLWQFDRILGFLAKVKAVKAGNNDGVSRKFLTTVARNSFLHDIKDVHFFFGAAFWRKGLAQKFQAAITEWSRLASTFSLSRNPAEKIRIFRQIADIERIWYSDSDYPANQTVKLDVSDDAITELIEVDGAFKHLGIIVSSGDRYKIEENEDAANLSNILRGGSHRLIRRTRRKLRL